MRGIIFRGALSCFLRHILLYSSQNTQYYTTGIRIIFTYGNEEQRSVQDNSDMLIKGKHTVCTFIWSRQRVGLFLIAMLRPAKRF